MYSMLGSVLGEDEMELADVVFAGPLLDLNNKELAEITNQSWSSINRTKRRIRSILNHPVVGLAARYDVSLAWQNQGACQREEVEIFFPKRGQTTNAAEYCGQCVVKETCLDYALTNSLSDGIWGDHSGRQRRQLTKEAEEAKALEKLAVEEQQPEEQTTETD
jgi:hypothetical protein